MGDDDLLIDGFPISNDPDEVIQQVASMGKKTSKMISANSWGIAKNYQYADPKMVNMMSLVPPMNFNY